MNRPESLTWSRRQVAEALGRSTTWLYHNAALLEAAGFPRPLPVLDRYDPVAVRAWCTNTMLSGAPSPAVPSTDDEVAAWQAELDRRAMEDAA